MKITEAQTDALTEVVNIGVGRAAAMLSDLIHIRIELHVPSVELCTRQRAHGYLKERGLGNATAIAQPFTGQVNGQACLLFPQPDGLTFAKLLAGEDESPDEIDLELSGILLEIGNIVLNGVVGSISNLLNYRFNYEPPKLCAQSFLDELFVESDEKPEKNAACLLANALFTVANKNIDGSILLAFELGGTEQLQSAVDALV